MLFILLIPAFYAILSLGNNIIGNPLDFLTKIVVSVIVSGVVSLALGRKE